MHVPCEKCGSSDAAWRYPDGHEYCHKCGAYTPSNGDTRPVSVSAPTPMIESWECVALNKRGLTEETCMFWEYGVGQYGNQPVQIANYRTPDGTRIVAQKVRFANKDFRFLGNPSEAGLYGQWKWRDGGKRVIITEGEIDALSVSQLQGNKWPVVSIPTGANGAKRALQRQLEWLEKFEQVVLMFDMDEPGRAAAKECAELFTPGKACIASLPLKDANDCLKAGRGDEVIKAQWEAKPFRPDGIVAGTEVWGWLWAEDLNDALPFHFPGLQEKTQGARRGEIITFVAGSGMGKSEIVRQIYYRWLVDYNETLGLIHLEEKIKRTSFGLMGLHLKRRLYLSTEGVSAAEMRDAYDKTVGSGRVFMYDHFGSTDSENLFSKIKYLAKGCGCTTIVLDHLSIVVSATDEDGSERELIDKIMTRLASLAQELNVRILLISHLKKADGEAHEEGGRVHTKDLRGSNSILQLSFTVVALERNQQDEHLRHYTLLRVLKCRHTGETGEAGWLKYDTLTGLLEPCNKPEEEEEDLPF